LKESTREVFKMHGWRVDRAAHNWLYFVFYDLYVRVFLRAGNLVGTRINHMKRKGLSPCIA